MLRESIAIPRRATAVYDLTMSFRRPHQHPAWRDRIRALGDLTWRAGVPAWVLEDEHTWQRFVQSAYAVNMKKDRFFGITDLSLEQLGWLTELMGALGCSRDDIFMCVDHHPSRAAVVRKLGEAGQ
jgi:hypothetical protein